MDQGSTMQIVAQLDRQAEGFGLIDATRCRNFGDGLDLNNLVGVIGDFDVGERHAARVESAAESDARSTVVRCVEVHVIDRSVEVIIGIGRFGDRNRQLSHLFRLAAARFDNHRVATTFEDADAHDLREWDFNLCAKAPRVEVRVAVEIDRLRGFVYMVADGPRLVTRRR